MQTTKFKIGQGVKWASGAGGTMKSKKGTVIAIVRPGKAPAAKLAKAARATGAVRSMTSYVVKTTAGKIYWPRTTHLKQA